jgi:hypothetical protein
MVENKSEKFLKVGLITKKRGGKAKSSSGGLNAFEKMKIIGKSIKAANGNSKI